MNNIMAVSYIFTFLQTAARSNPVIKTCDALNETASFFDFSFRYVTKLVVRAPGYRD